MHTTSITDRTLIHKYIVMAIIGRPAVHGHMRSLTAISFTPAMRIIIIIIMQHAGLQDSIKQPVQSYQ